MAKFNVKGSGTKTENLAGGEAFQETPKLEFVSLLLTSFVKDQFYRSEDESIQRVSELMDKIADKKFLGKAAIYARTKFGMRSISHVVAGEIAKKVKGPQRPKSEEESKSFEWTKRFFDQIIYRPDDMLEIMGYLDIKNNPIPNSVKRGFRTAIGKFNEYELSKYRGEKKVIKLIDLVNLVHPKPGKKNETALKKLVEGDLKSTETWESKLTQAGQKAESEEEKEELKKDAWTELIKEKKIGYFALVKNLRNIIEQAPEIIPDACEMLIDENLIRKSLVLPFRFSTAITEVEKISGPEAKKVIRALNTAIDISTANVPKFDGETLVVLDSSGSMKGRTQEIGSLFAAILVKSNDADFITFADNAKYVSLNSNDSTLTLCQKINDAGYNGGTSFHCIFRCANRAYKRIIILSDMQGWIGYDNPSKSFAEYRKKTTADPFVYSFDLAGHGTLQFPEKSVYCLAGFSEKVFDIMKLLEQDRSALISEIEKIEL
jgi:hypothetical protein